MMQEASLGGSQAQKLADSRLFTASREGHGVAARYHCLNGHNYER